MARRRRTSILLVLGAVVMLAACPKGPKPATPDATGCMVGGCSGQLCTDANDGLVASTCEYREAYACYGKHSTCERQPSGECGWTPTAALTQCLDTSK